MLAFVLVSLDPVVTAWALSRGASELNPLLDLFIASYGAGWAMALRWVVGVTVVSAVVLFIEKGWKLTDDVLVAINAVWMVIVGWNLLGIAIDWFLGLA